MSILLNLFHNQGRGRPIGGGAAPTFVPTDIAGIGLWLVGSDYTVGSWPDKSGAGFDFIQVVGANQPSAQTVGDKSVVRFDGSSDYLTRAAVLGVADTQGTLFIVFSSDEPADAYIFSVSDDAGNSRRILFGISGAHKPELTQRNADTADVIRGGTTINDSVWRCMVFKSTGTAYNIYLNSVAEALLVSSGANNGDWIGDCTSLDVTAIGVWQFSALYGYLKGDVVEIIYYNTGLSNADRALVEQYLSDKYSLGF